MRRFMDSSEKPCASSTAMSTSVGSMSCARPAATYSTRLTSVHVASSRTANLYPSDWDFVLIDFSISSMIGASRKSKELLTFRSMPPPRQNVKSSLLFAMTAAYFTTKSPGMRGAVRG